MFISTFATALERWWGVRVGGADVIKKVGGGGERGGGEGEDENV